MEHLQNVLEKLFPASYQFICARAGDPIAAIQGLQDNLQKLTIENNDAGRLVDIVSFNLTSYAELSKSLRMVGGNGQPQLEIYFLATAVIKTTQINQVAEKKETASGELFLSDKELDNLPPY
jgi:hypothetical protein